MIVSVIKQDGLKLSADDYKIPFQHSANIQMKFEKDENYSDYAVMGFFKKSWDNEEKKLVIDENGIFSLAGECFEKTGTLSISFVLLNSDSKIHLGVIDYEIRKAFGSGDEVLPEPDETWITLVTQVAKDAIKDDVALVNQKASEALNSATLASEKANEASLYANNAKEASNNATTAAGQAITAKNDAIAASNQAFEFSNNASESAIEAKNSADEALENANASNKAIETVNQIKTQIEDKANEFDTNYQEKLTAFNDNATEKQNAFNQSVTSANDLFDKKVVDANNDLDSKLQQANTTINEKVTEATNQANEAKKQAQIATDEVAKVPNLIEGKLDKNLGSENANKVLTTDSQGNIVTENKEDFEGGGTTDYNDLENKPSINGVELKGNVTSEQLGIIAKNDNFIYKDVDKSLNPSIDDGFKRAMWNLKLYGKSTQGADPSPTNKQDITAISQFDGAPTGENIAPQNLNVELGTSSFYPVSYEFINNQYVCQLKEGGTTSQFRFYWKQTLPKGTYTINLNFIINGNNVLTSDRLPIFVLNALDNSYIAYGVKGKPTTFTLTQETECYFQSSFYQASLKITSAIVYDLKLELGTTATPYTPYQSQPFTYTPTQNMYSTQDGSISDYVDVEKGGEVYNMKRITFNNTQMSSVAYMGSTTSGYSKFTFKLPYNSVIDRKINTIILCSVLEGTQGAWYTDKINIVSGDNNSKDVYYANVDGSITTKEDFLALFENDVELVYILETPTEIPIPQEQLAMLKALYTYNGVTNFLCNAPVSFSYEISQQINKQNVENRLKALEAKLLLQGGN